jgi:hypothetical protein
MNVRVWSRNVRCAAALLAGASLAACESGTAPERPGALREIGVLQFAPAGTILAAERSGDPDDPVEHNVKWDSPPPTGFLFSPKVIEAPDTVRVGQPTMVRVTTIGDGGCWSADGIDVKRSGSVVELTPFDVHSGAQICTMILLYLEHPTTLTFDAPGEAVIRVKGRRAREGNRTWQEPVTGERTIVVVP